MFETLLELEKACAAYVAKGYQVAATMPGGAGYVLIKDSRVVYLLWLGSLNVKRVLS